MSFRNGLIGFLVLVCGVVFGAGGRWLAAGNGGAELSKETVKVAAAIGTSRNSTRPASVGGAVHPEGPEGEDAQAGAAAANPAFVAAVKKFGLESLQQQFAQYVPATDAGRTLIELAVLSEMHSNVGSPEAAVADAAFQRLRAEPVQAFGAVRDTLDQLPVEVLADKRQYLIQFAARLDVEGDEQLALLMTEGKRTPPKNAKGVEDSSPSVALEMAFEVVKNDPARSEQMLRDLLENHRGNARTQRMLISSFARIDANRAREIEREFKLSR